MQIAYLLKKEIHFTSTLESSNEIFNYTTNIFCSIKNEPLL